MAVARSAVEFIWEGQQGLFEVAHDPARRKQFERTAALDALPRMRFIAPLARKQPGSTKAHVADRGNVLWADIDSRDALTRIDTALVPLGLTPSLVVDSGNKGFWIYLKLDALIPVAHLEILNQRLGRLVGGDHCCWNRDRLARLPGSIHPDSRRLASVVQFTGELFAASAIDHALPDETTSTAVPTAPGGQIHEPGVGLTVQLPKEHPPLALDLRQYIAARPKKGEGWDRSVYEQRIFTTLVAAGWNDEQILTFADLNSLSKHTQERLKRSSYEYSLRSITKSRSYLAKNPSSSSNVSMCIQPVQHRKYLNRDEFLAHADGCTGVQIISWATALGYSDKTARRALKSLLDGGYLYRTRKGRTYLYAHTDRAKTRAAAAKFKPTLFLPAIGAGSSSQTRRAW